MRDDPSKLTKLGSQGTQYQFQEPSPEMLEVFPNQYPHRDYQVVYETDEMTSLCPRTSQPDYATVRISYVPDKVILETKSLKLYLFSYRNVGSFMETICNRILEDIVSKVSPRRITVECSFRARGGITTQVTATHEK